MVKKRGGGIRSIFLFPLCRFQKKFILLGLFKPPDIYKISTMDGFDSSSHEFYFFRLFKMSEAAPLEFPSEFRKTY